MTTFLITSKIEHFFMHLIAICIYPSGECLFEFLPFLNCVLVSLLSCESFIYSEYKSFIRNMICKYFSQVNCIPFKSFNVF